MTERRGVADRTGTFTFKNGCRLNFPSPFWAEAVLTAMPYFFLNRIPFSVISGLSVSF